MTVHEYANSLTRQGQLVVPGSSDTYWVRYEHLSMARIPSFETKPLEPGELDRVFRATRCLAATCVLEPDELHPENAWLYLATDRGYALESLPKKVRNTIRTGLREFTFSVVATPDLLAQGATAYCDTRARAGLSDGTTKSFDAAFRSWCQLQGTSVLGAWRGDLLAGFVTMAELNGWVELGLYSRTDCLRWRPNDPLVYSALRTSLADRGAAGVSFGLSSIQEGETGLHFFKVKLGFEAKPIHRMFALRPSVELFNNPLTRGVGHVGLRILPKNRRLRKAVGALEYLAGKGVFDNLSRPGEPPSVV